MITASKHFDRDLLNQMEEHARNFDKRNPGTMPAQWKFDNNPNFDAAEGVFLARQLEFIRPGLYKVVYPALKAQGLFPFDYGTNTGAEQYTVRAVDRAGDVKVTKQLAGDIPMLKILAKEASTSIFSLVQGYEYTIQDARNAIMAGTPLPAMLAEAVKEEMERKLDDIAFQGETVSGVLGALNQTTALTYTTPTTGTAGSASWDSKSPDQILLDLNGAPNQIVSNSNEVEQPDTWLLPTTRLNLIRSTRVGDGTSTSILAYYLGNQELIKKVESTFKSETLGSGSSKRGMCYRNDPMKMMVVVPQPFEQMQPVTAHFSVVTACHMRTAGMVLTVGQSVIYADNI